MTIHPPSGTRCENSDDHRRRRRLRERRWRKLLRLQRDLSRLVVERMSHGLVVEADPDPVDDLLEQVEADLAQQFPRRWARAQPALLAESAAWWHVGANTDRDGLQAVLACQHCRLLAGGLSHWLSLPA